ncbi:pyrimidine 5'-nucleotidase [Vitreimonas sp.]|uniref:pyrimidine 5'-nucleotidase n=1 Tax=Vitreimonas sp. TaxID=3069702 RepID=UPI002EDA03CE
MPLAGIRDWVFDLDNTLYPAPTLYDAIGERMTAYIARHAQVDDVRALELREHYFHEYGATVVGLSRHHGIDPDDFMLDVHDVDYSVLGEDHDLAALIGRLPGRRIIFTNGGGGHAERTLKALGLDAHFDCVFDLGDAGYAPKPQRESYTRLCHAYDIDPARAILVEDTLRNLEPAHDLGFATALVGPVHPDPRPTYVQHYAHDVHTLLRGWLGV